jgi:hypothetical protein
MESRQDAILNFLGDSYVNKLTVYEQEELIWLVAMIYTKEFYGKHQAYLLNRTENYDNYFQKVSEFVYGHEEAKKLITKLKNELIYDEGEEKPENVDLQKVNSLSFFHWVEANQIRIPSDVIESIKWLIQKDYYDKQYKAEQDMKFPKVEAEKLAVLMKEPLWSLYNAVLYVNGICSTQSAENIIKYIKNHKHIEKLCLYITQAHSAKKLKLIEGGTNFNYHEDLQEVNYLLIDKFSVEPDVFINFIKTLPLEFPILDVKDNPKNTPVAKSADKNNKYSLSTKETNTLFKLIAGMAKDGYGYDPALLKNVVTSDIERATGISGKTAKKWIDKSIEIANSIKDENSD